MPSDDSSNRRSGRRVCPGCSREVVVTARVMERCGAMDVCCPDCGCAFEPEEWQVDAETDRFEIDNGESVSDVPLFDDFDGCGLCDSDLTNDRERDTGVCDECAKIGGDL